MRAYIAPVLAFLAAVLGAAKDVQKFASPRLIGWIAIVLAIGALVATIHTVASQQRELRLHERAWKGALVRAVGDCVAILRYIAFAAAQYDRQIRSRNMSHEEAVGNIQWPVRGLEQGYSKPPSLDALLTDSWVEKITSYRVDPPRSIGGPWTSIVPFGEDVHQPVTSVLAEQVPKALEGLRSVQAMYGHLLPGEITSALGRAIENGFPRYLADLSSFVKMRSVMEDSRFPNVRLIGANGAPNVSQYKSWVEILIELKRALEDDEASARAA
jgi:hypothetical protein